jgi:hypothetical protein
LLESLRKIFGKLLKKPKKEIENVAPIQKIKQNENLDDRSNRHTRYISDVRREIERARIVSENRLFTNSELERIEKDEYYKRFLDESYSLERLSVQGDVKRGKPYHVARIQSSKETKRVVAEIRRERTAIEIKTAQQFDLVVANSEGFIVITDIATGNKIHRPRCKWITKRNFEEKVVSSNCRNGHYYWTNNMNLVEYLHAKPCSFCKP